MTYFLAFVFGCLFNRIRGGAFSNARHKFERYFGIQRNIMDQIVRPLKWYQEPIAFLNRGDVLNCIAFYFWIALGSSFQYDGMIDGLPHYSMGDANWETAFYATLAMFIGASIGWGKYIGAMGGWVKTGFYEFRPIDKLIERFQNRPVLWGFYGLTLRGLLWGALLGLALNSVSPMIAGAFMGVCYWIALKISKKPNRGWELGEILFGGILWLSC